MVTRSVLTSRLRRRRRSARAPPRPTLASNGPLKASSAPGTPSVPATCSPGLYTPPADTPPSPHCWFIQRISPGTGAAASADVQTPLPCCRTLGGSALGSVETPALNLAPLQVPDLTAQLSSLKGVGSGIRQGTTAAQRSQESEWRECHICHILLVATYQPQGVESAVCLCRQGTETEVWPLVRGPVAHQGQPWDATPRRAARVPPGLPQPRAEPHAQLMAEILNHLISCVCFRISYKWLAFENQSRIIGSIKIMRWVGTGTLACVIHLASGRTGAIQSQQGNGSSVGTAEGHLGCQRRRHTYRYASLGDGKSVSCAGRRPLRRRQGDEASVASGARGPRGGPPHAPRSGPPRPSIREPPIFQKHVTHGAKRLSSSKPLNCIWTKNN